MIDRSHELALATQARLLGIARSTVYRESRPVSAADLAAMRRIDELHLDYPFAGSRLMRSMLANEGMFIGRRHVRTLMGRMRIEALYRRPRAQASGQSPAATTQPSIRLAGVVLGRGPAWRLHGREMSRASYLRRACGAPRSA